jgi:hypothetical protein
MRRDRFEAILTNMHFADRATDYPTGEDGLPREGRLPAGERNWDIQGYQDLLTTAWQVAADYTQTCALDEKGYRTKSKRMPGKQRNIAKPARYFIKAFAVAASDAPLRGYVYNISMYGGKGDGAENPDGAKVDYVMRSLPSSMDNDNIAVVLDSYYGGETVLQRLRERGIDGMMTVGASAVSHLFEKRDNGKVYQTGKKAGQKKLDAALEKGEFRNAVANVRDPHPHAAPGATMEVYFMRFKDKGEFGTLSSYIRQEALVTCKRTATEEKHDDSGVVTQRKGAKVEVDLPCQVSYCLLVTTYYSLLTTYYLLLTTYYLRSGIHLYTKIRRRRYKRRISVVPLVRSRLEGKGARSAIPSKVLGTRRRRNWQRLAVDACAADRRRRTSAHYST